MLTRSNGYFLLELLLTLGIFFITTLTILPMYVYIEKQTQEARIQREAVRLLYDKLQGYLINGDAIPYETVTLNARKYELTLDLSHNEGCVYYEDVKNKKKIYCKSFK